MGVVHQYDRVGGVDFERNITLADIAELRKGSGIVLVEDGPNDAYIIHGGKVYKSVD